MLACSGDKEDDSKKNDQFQLQVLSPSAHSLVIQWIVSYLAVYAPLVDTLLGTGATTVESVKIVKAQGLSKEQFLRRIAAIQDLAMRADILRILSAYFPKEDDDLADILQEFGFGGLCSNYVNDNDFSEASMEQRLVTSPFLKEAYYGKMIFIRKNGKFTFALAYAINQVSHSWFSLGVRLEQPADRKQLASYLMANAKSQLNQALKNEMPSYVSLMPVDKPLLLQ